MDGLNFKAPSGIIDKFFKIDNYGLVYPYQEASQLGRAKERVERLLKSGTDTAFKLGERYYLTDVETTNNPYGNTNAIGAGISLFGPQPMSGVPFRGRMDIATNNSAGMGKIKELEKREGLIERYAIDVLSHHKKQQPAEGTVEYTLWEIEHDQALTGGGFDGNKVGDITLTAMNGMIKSTKIPEIANSTVSEKFVESCLEFRDYLVAHGLPLGSLQPDGLSKVRFEQDNDGMLGFPVLRKGGAPLDQDIATRLLIESGVDTRSMVGTMVRDRNTGTDYPYRVQDALAYVLDHWTPSPEDLTSIVIFLARIQKHGWKEGDGDTVIAKPGKARAVFPNSAREACIEGMLINPYNRKLQELKIPCFTSLQDKPTRVSIIKDWMKAAQADGYGFLAADWSQYDATVPGWGLATILQLCVKPFFNAKWHNWVDAVTLILTYKYFVLDEDLARINGQTYSECVNLVENVPVDRYRLFALKDYLISGAKFTHVGGSEYGVCAIHLTLPKLLGFKGIVGQQAGDDTLMAVPIESIHLDSKEATYEPIASAAKSIGLDINPGKQIFYQYDGELVGIFLQDSYCVKGDVWGIGSAYRPLSAIFYSERNRGLTVSEQLMAEISRMSSGVDSPFIDSAVEFWLSKEQFLGVLVKERGASRAFQDLIESVGYPLEEIAQRIDVGSFSYSIGIDDLKSGKLPILDAMDRVASGMKFNVNLDKAASSIGVSKGGSTSHIEVAESLDDSDDIGILAD
mgnify:CR=1 FL=1